MNDVMLSILKDINHALKYLQTTRRFDKELACKHLEQAKISIALYQDTRAAAMAENAEWNMLAERGAKMMEEQNGSGSGKAKA